MAAMPSYQELLVYYKLEEADMKERCSEEAIKALAPKLTNWELDHLCMGKETVDSVKSDFKKEEEKKLNYLLRWKEECSINATYDEMAKRFMQARKASLAEHVCEECKKHLKKVADNKEQQEVKVFQATTEHDQPSDYRDGAAIQDPSVTSNQTPTSKGHRGSLFPPGQQAQENGRDQTSHLVSGSKPAQNIAPQPSTAVPESNIAWEVVSTLTSILLSEKKEKTDIHARKEQKEIELKAEIWQLESDVKDLKGKIEELKKENEARSEQERVYQKELKDKECEIIELRAVIKELQQEREKQEELKRQPKRENGNVVDQCEELQEEAVKPNAEYVKEERTKCTYQVHQHAHGRYNAEDKSET